MYPEWVKDENLRSNSWRFNFDPQPDPSRNWERLDPTLDSWTPSFELMGPTKKQGGVGLSGLHVFKPAPKCPLGSRWSAHSTSPSEAKANKAQQSPARLLNQSSASGKLRHDASGTLAHYQGSLHCTPEHCLVNGGVPLFWQKKQHVSNGCKMEIF